MAVDHHFTISERGEIHSRQRLSIVMPPAGRFDLERAVGRLGPLYFARLARVSGGLIRVRRRGDRIRFELGPTRLPILSFAPPYRRELPDGAAMVWPIRGGLMQAPLAPEGGALLISIEREGDERLLLTMEIAGYFSRIMGQGRVRRSRRWLYERSQAALHHLIANDYLNYLAREIRAGHLAPV